MSHRDIELLAIGAGPANLALAVALEEMAPASLARDSLIIEQQDGIVWQPGMLLPWSQSQVSFLKDLVTLRNPVSKYSFINYLHDQSRLDDFINLGTFTPYRSEISQYLRWVAESLEKVRIEYGRRAVRVEPLLDADGTPGSWLVHLADGSTIACRYLVIGAGRDANIPDVLKDVDPGRYIHSTEFLTRTDELDALAPKRVIVVGGAQSAAEMLWTAYQRYPEAECTMVMRSIGLSTYDGSKFTNELFYPSFIDEFHASRPEARAQMLSEMHRANYAGLAPSLLDSMYRQMYLEKLDGTQRLHMVTLSDITAARSDEDEVVLTLSDRRDGSVRELAGDVVLLGTGFVRDMPAMVRGFGAALGLDSLTVDRNYLLQTGASGPTSALCYLQGVNEATHGIADSLLSVLAARSGEITTDILRRRAGVRPTSATPSHTSADADENTEEEAPAWSYAG
ncbi:lysine N(6)-hydroxylase/L-ornithine N(5)-oxygenase family protein [Streptomyces purpureus]|uniref:L-lysine N6-monooxygenase MbtG n=1 Tax=Streptomyces purpureus TaxID=1951 RepID=A0A918GVS0_9ACTN|nr:SidA/IucD/PvdA family monooxygenase [Streptomyces purpureus]GGT12431.1 L-ornithine N(5)-monooxygenase [Streptomyces purpureus]